MNNVFLVDDQLDRTDYVRRLFEERRIPGPIPTNLEEISEDRSHEITPIVIVHWSVLDRAYSELSRLKRMNRVKMVFYCTCPEKRDRGRVLLLPEELDEMIASIVELQLAG